MILNKNRIRNLQISAFT
uniref:Uncharacterized protein n=1 Tax=Rhizophora mucronata TaxID=61149 RepID=A0A2P2PHU8_RHIMU